MVMNPISLPGFLVKGMMTILYIATFEHGTCGITWCTTEGFQRIDDSMTAFRRNDEFPVRISLPNFCQADYISFARTGCVWTPDGRALVPDSSRSFSSRCWAGWAPITLRAILRSFRSIFVFGQRVVSWRGISEFCGQKIDWILHTIMRLYAKSYLYMLKCFKNSEHFGFSKSSYCRLFVSNRGWTDSVSESEAKWRPSRKSPADPAVVPGRICSDWFIDSLIIDKHVVYIIRIIYHHLSYKVDTWNEDQTKRMLIKLWTIFPVRIWGT